METNRNAETEANELAAWASTPDTFHGYDSGRVLTTWMGTALGVIMERREYTNRLTGSTMTTLRIMGSNGSTYYGRYGSDWSQLVTIRKAKRDAYAKSA